MQRTKNGNKKPKFPQTSQARKTWTTSNTRNSVKSWKWPRLIWTLIAKKSTPPDSCGTKAKTAAIRRAMKATPDIPSLSGKTRCLKTVTLTPDSSKLVHTLFKLDHLKWHHLTKYIFIFIFIDIFIQINSRWGNQVCQTKYWRYFGN